MKTLKKFLEKNGACKDGFDFAKDLTLEQFLNTCDRGDWILWLFARMNPDSVRELTLAKGHCANTVRHLMEDQRSIKAVDVAIAFGEGRATKTELDDASYAAYAATDAAGAFAAGTAGAFAAGAAGAASYAAAGASGVAVDAAGAAYAAAFAAAGAFAAGTAGAIKDNQKQTADICRKYLPLEIWNNN